MNSKENILALAAINPDYMGFIFYEKSPRYFRGELPDFQKTIKKVGVFVNESIQKIVEKQKLYQLDIVQLHGNESIPYCQELKAVIPNIELWKSFSVDKKFEFPSLHSYRVVDKYLLDTKGTNPGGNGVSFDWEILKNYDLDKPLVLSGGISLEKWEQIHELKQKIKQIEIIDINSRFELKPGIKDIQKVDEFIQKIKS